MSDDRYWRDEWPDRSDGNVYDGTKLLQLMKGGRSPFGDVWDVNLLIDEVERALSTKVTDVPLVTHGSNNYGFHFKLSNQPDVIARLARGDVNMPEFDGLSLEFQVSEIRFEAAVYELLRSEPKIKTSQLLYHRAPAHNQTPGTELPRTIIGRHLMVFRRADGRNNVWGVLNSEQRKELITQAAAVRAALFKFEVPISFAVEWLLERICGQKPESIPVPVAPTRDFCAALFTSKIEATIKNEGDMIGWESDNNVVGPVAASAKQSLLRLIPQILPPEEGDKPIFYRLVLEHGDFGIHNMTIHDGNITSLFDWETGCIVPALLSHNLIAANVDMVADENGRPSLGRADIYGNFKDVVESKVLSQHYHKILYEKAPEYEKAIQAGKDARHLWFALQTWRGDAPEQYFGELGAWAERRMQEMNVEST